MFGLSSSVHEIRIAMIVIGRSKAVMRQRARGLAWNNGDITAVAAIGRESRASMPVVRARIHEGDCGWWSKVD